MNAEQYTALSRPFRDNPAALRTLVLVNDGLKWLCYLLYPMLLILVALHDPSLLLKEILVPAVLFIGLSVFRRLYNAPRPYEALAIDPLIHKDTQGKSFPSRHIFSVFMIAMCWLAYCPLVRHCSVGGWCGHGGRTCYRGSALPQRCHRGGACGRARRYSGAVDIALVLVPVRLFHAWVG